MKKLNKAFVYRLKPTEEQASFFKNCFGCSRFVYNKMLADRISIYDKYKSDKALLKKQKNPTPAHYKKAFPFLKDVDSLALANSQMNLGRAFSNFFKGDAKFPNFKSKRRDRASYTTNNQKGTIHIENLGNRKAFIKLPKLKTKVKVILHREIPKDHLIKSATIYQLPSGKYEVSILTEYHKTIEVVPVKETVGLDYSMADFYVSSDGEIANYPRYYRLMQDKLAKEQKILARRKVGSNRYETQRIKVAKFHEKVKNQRKDFLHKTSTKLAERYDAVFLEDINLRDMSRALRFGKSISDNGFGMFREFLAYKLEERGKVLLKIDKWFPSSKKCFSCDNVKAKLLLSERTYNCDVCHYVSCRDSNAANNIEEEGFRLLAI